MDAGYVSQAATPAIDHTIASAINDLGLTRGALMSAAEQTEMLVERLVGACTVPAEARPKPFPEMPGALNVLGVAVADLQSPIGRIQNALAAIERRIG